MNNTQCAGLPTDNLSNVASVNTTLYTSWAFIFILLSAFVILANAIVIISLLRSHFKDKSGATTNVRLVRSLMMSLAVSDAIIGAFSMPLGIYELFKNGHWGLGEDLCGIKQITDVFLCTVSIYHVVCMAVDRYLAISKPFLYRTLTLRTSWYMIGVCWTVPGILCLVLFMKDWNLTGVTDVAMCFKLNDYCIIIVNLRHQIVSVTISFYIPFVVMYVLYFIIAREVWAVYSRTPQFRGRFSLIKGQHFPNTPAPFVTCNVDTNESHYYLNKIWKGNAIPKESRMECSQSMADIENRDEIFSILSPQEQSSNRTDQNSLSCSSILKSLKRFSPRPGARKLSSSRERNKAGNTFVCKTSNTVYNPLFEIDNCESTNRVRSCKLGAMKPTNHVQSNVKDHGDLANRVSVSEINYRASTNCGAAFKIDATKRAHNSPACDLDNCELCDKVSDCEVSYCESTNHVWACELNNDVSANRISPCESDGTRPAYSDSVASNPNLLLKKPEVGRLLSPVSTTHTTLPSEKDSSTKPGGTQISSNKRLANRKHIGKSNTTSVGKRLARPTRALNERPANASGNMKAVWTIGSVVVCFTLCWLPFSIHVVVLSYYNYGLPMWPYHLVTWLGYLNSALNPLLYCCNKSIRESVKSLLLPARDRVSSGS